MSEIHAHKRTSRAKSINDLSPNAVIEISGDFKITISDILSEDLAREYKIYSKYHPIGSLIEIGHIVLEEGCMNSYEVLGVESYDGWGPMLYDIAMEVSAERGGLGIYSSRYSVQREAWNIWDFYYRYRKDVKWKQMDDKLNTLTPTKKDNCLQPWGFKDRPYDTAYEGPDAEDWQSEEARLSKVYYKNIDLLPRLRKKVIVKEH